MGIKPLTKFQSQSVKLATHRFNIWEGAVRASKSVSCDIKWIEFINGLNANRVPEDDAPLIMMGKTERTLKRNVIDPLTAILGKSRCKLNMGQGELQILGRKCYIAGANNELAVSKIAGLTIRGAYGDEISLWPESVWKMLGTRLSLEGSQFFGTTNPDSPAHFLKKDYLDPGAMYFDSQGGLVTKQFSEGADPVDLIQFHYRLGDNPFLPPSYVQSLLREYKGLWKLRYIDGEWVIADGAIYSMFDPMEHVRYKSHVSPYPDIIGIDYGTTNPFVALAVEIRPEGLHIFSELYVAKPLTDAELSQKLQNWIAAEGINPGWICIDPSAASFKRQLHKDKVGNVYDADNSVNDGLRLCASLYATGRLTIAPACEHTREEVTGYCWNSEASKKGLDEPIKLNDHCMDGKRYAVKSTERIWRNKISV